MVCAIKYLIPIPIQSTTTNPQPKYPPINIKSSSYPFSQSQTSNTDRHHIKSRILQYHRPWKYNTCIGYCITLSYTVMRKFNNLFHVQGQYNNYWNLVKFILETIKSKFQMLCSCQYPGGCYFIPGSTWSSQRVHC